MHKFRERAFSSAPSFSEAAARLLLLFAGLVMTALDRKLRLLLLFLRPMSQRITPPWFLQIERGQLQALPHLDGALHEFTLGQRQGRVGPRHGGVDEEPGRSRRLVARP